MLETFGTGAILFLLTGLLLAIPLLMALWFAPPLVVFRNAEPIAALKASFNANVRQHGCRCWSIAFVGLCPRDRCVDPAHAGLARRSRRCSWRAFTQATRTFSARPVSAAALPCHQ